MEPSPQQHSAGVVDSEVRRACCLRIAVPGTLAGRWIERYGALSLSRHRVRKLASGSGFLTPTERLPDQESRCTASAQNMAQTLATRI